MCIRILNIFYAYCHHFLNITYIPSQVIKFIKKQLWLITINYDLQIHLMVVSSSINLFYGNGPWYFNNHDKGDSCIDRLKMCEIALSTNIMQERKPLQGYHQQNNRFITALYIFFMRQQSILCTKLHTSYESQIMIITHYIILFVST